MALGPCSWSSKCSCATIVLVAMVAVVVPPMLSVPAAVVAESPASEPPFEIIHQLGGLIEAFVADGDQLYLGIGSRLVVLNADTDSSVPEGGTQYIVLPHTIQDAAVLEPRLVAVLAGNVVFFVDTADPDALTIMGRYDHGVRLGGIESWGGSVYLLGDDDMFVVAALDPAAATHVGTLRMPDAFGVRSHMLAADGIVFLGHGSAGVVVVDVSVPDDPRMIGGIEENIVVRRMAVAGRRLYVRDASNRFDSSGNQVAGVYVHVLDVEPAGTIVQHGLVTLIEATPTPPAFGGSGAVAYGDHFCVSGSETDWETFVWENQLRCWDMSDPAAPVAMPIVGYSRLGSSVALAASNGRVFVASNDAALVPDYQYQSPGVGTFDVTDPTEAEWKGYWQLDDLGRVAIVGANSSNVVVKERYGLIHLYPGAYEAGKQRASYIDLPPRSVAEALCATEDRAYFMGLGDLHVYDTSDLAQPELLATAPVTTRRTSLAIDEPYVYSQVGCGGGMGPGGETYCTLVTLEVVEGDGASRVEELAQVPVGYQLRDIAVGAGYAYIVVRLDGGWEEEQLALYDVRDPRLPRFVENIELGEWVWPKRTVVRDGLAYVATRTLTEEEDPVSTGLTILDVEDAPNVSAVGSVELPTDIKQSNQPNDRNGHLALSGEYALYSSDEPFVHVIDVSNPSSPVEVQRIQAPAVVTDLDAATGQVYVVSDDGGMMVLRATGLEGPQPDVRGKVYLPFAIAVHR